MTIRNLFLALIFAVALGMVPASPTHAGDPVTGASELAQSSVMECMERCIRAEGKAEKATCKSRCARIPARGSSKPDCMTVYKSCRSTCGSNKECKRACKARLMQCS